MCGPRVLKLLLPYFAVLGVSTMVCDYAVSFYEIDCP